jgi:hypothetical protein
MAGFWLSRRPATQCLCPATGLSGLIRETPRRRPAEFAGVGKPARVRADKHLRFELSRQRGHCEIIM